MPIHTEALIDTICQKIRAASSEAEAEQLVSELRDALGE
jgi:hypothetical protein